jgi:hypothetical protein
VSKRVVGIVILVFSIIALFAPVTSNTAQAHTEITSTGPTAQTWYFAEGRVGGGFVQWLTVGNPNDSTCTVNIEYDYTLDRDGSNHQKKITLQTNRLSRVTEYVNNDLGITQFNLDGANVSAIVSTSDCPGIVSERPMYFQNFHGVSSGTDVLGATKPLNTWYFAEVPRSTAGETFLSILNPNSADADVTVTYYNGSIVPVSETKTVPANSRGTFEPNKAALSGQTDLGVTVTSTQEIVVERASYYPTVNGVQGSADVMGIASPSTSWIFPAGTTREGTSEFITVANPNDYDIEFTLFLASESSGIDFPFNLHQTLARKSTKILNINSNNTFTGKTDNVSTIVLVTSHNNPTVGESDTILAQRQLFETYTGSTFSQIQGVSDSPGIPGEFERNETLKINNQPVYSFAEGFTSVGFDEWFMLVNPNKNDITVSITLTNMLGEKDTQSVLVKGFSRYSFDVNKMVKSSTFSLNNVKAYAVSAVVSSNDGPFGVERSMYWNAFGTQGTDVVPGFM